MDTSAYDVHNTPPSYIAILSSKVELMIFNSALSCITAPPNAAKQPWNFELAIVT